MINLQLEIDEHMLVESLARLDYNIIQSVFKEVDAHVADADFTYMVALWFAKELKIYPEYWKEFMEEVSK